MNYCKTNEFIIALSNVDLNAFYQLIIYKIKLKILANHKISTNFIILSTINQKRIIATKKHNVFSNGTIQSLKDLGPKT